MSNPSEHQEKDQSRGNGPDEAGQGTTTESARWSRRRFGKAALVTTPVLATLYGRPLMAQHSCTPSGWVSGNTSIQHDNEFCGGRTPGYWQSDNSKRQVSGWEMIHLEPLNDPTHGFGFTNYQALRDDGTIEPATLDDAVQGPGAKPFFDTGELERQIIRTGTAALLNARFLDYALTEELVRDLVEAALLDGGYTTSSGDFLDPEDIKDFLQSTMDFDL